MADAQSCDREATLAPLVLKSKNNITQQILVKYEIFVWFYLCKMENNMEAVHNLLLGFGLIEMTEEPL